MNFFEYIIASGSSMSVFESLMMICFGAAWPFSIYKSLKSRSIEGKSVRFLWTIFTGYCAGIAHKAVYSMDGVIIIYILNALMVGFDLVLYYRNKRLSLSR